MIVIIFYILLGIMVVNFIYFFIIWLVGTLRGVHDKIIDNPHNYRYGVIICAHNEAEVIGELIQSLNVQNYPHDLYRVFVIADHCDDGTAEIAEANGAQVIKRDSGERNGKGLVLNYGINQILERYDQEIDNLCFFDADNIVEPDFLYHMNQRFNCGADIVMGNRHSKNPYASMLSTTYSIYWQVMRSIESRPRDNIGLQAMISGTGFGFKKQVLPPEGWQTITFTEDVEFYYQQSHLGHRIMVDYDAIFYDEQPETWDVTIKQLWRWTTGSNHIFRHYFFPYLIDYIKKPTLLVFDMLMTMLFTETLPLSAIVSIMGICLLASGTLPHGWLVFSLFVLGYLVYYVFGSHAMKVTDQLDLEKGRKGLMFLPVFVTIIGLLALFSLFFPSKKWKTIPHKSLNQKRDIHE